MPVQLDGLCTKHDVAMVFTVAIKACGSAGGAAAAAAAAVVAAKRPCSMLADWQPR